MKTQWIAFAIFVCVLTYQETDGRKHGAQNHQRKLAKTTKFSADLAKLNENLEATRTEDKRAENETGGEKEETKQSLSIDEAKDHQSNNNTSTHHHHGRHHGKKHHKGPHKKRHGGKHGHHHKRQPHKKHHRRHHGQDGKDVRENTAREGLDQPDLPKHARKEHYLKRLMKLAKRGKKQPKEIQTEKDSNNGSVE